jgi:hypothetical protein
MEKREHKEGSKKEKQENTAAEYTKIKGLDISFQSI